VIDLAVAAPLAALADPVVANRTSLLGRVDVDGDTAPDEVTTSSGASTLGRTLNGVASVRRAAPPLSRGQSRAMGPSTADFVVHGPFTDGNGRGQLIPDVTGDGFSDLLFKVDNDTPINLPRAMVVPLRAGGCAAGPVAIDLATATDVAEWLPGAVDDFFAGVVVVADFDGDGLNDVAFGAPDADGAVAGGRDGVVLIERGRADWDGDGLAGAADCEPFDATGGTVAGVPLLTVTGASPTRLDWMATIATWHVLSGRVSELRADRGFASVTVLASDFAVPSWTDTRPGPGIGDAWWYLIVAETACGFADLGSGAAATALESELCTLLP
jgi:hypothetical protein